METPKKNIAKPPTKDATLTLYNVCGQAVNQIRNISGHTVIVLRDHLSSGLYFLRLSENNTIIYTDKLVIINN